MYLQTVTTCSHNQTVFKRPLKSFSYLHRCSILVLQPSSSPYDIKDKLDEANRALSDDNPNLENRRVKIKFREELVDYEPEHTDDDVQSIESYDNLDFADDQPKLKLNVYPPAFSFDLGEGNEQEELCEYVDEETDGGENEIEEVIDVEDDDTTYAIEDANDSGEVEGNVVEVGDVPCIKETKKEHPQGSETRFQVNCRRHCIEKLELDLSISKLRIGDRKLCPGLKLIKRKCCEEKKGVENLPRYSGLHSEYGLSVKQLQKRQRTAERTKMREMKQTELAEEYKRRKGQQNEMIFRRWLDDISARKTAGKRRTPLATNVLNIAPKCVNKGDRPKTANCLVPRPRSTVRRKSSSARVFVEVPRKLLRRGVNVGHLVISDMSNRASSVGIHMVTLS